MDPSQNSMTMDGSASNKMGGSPGPGGGDSEDLTGQLLEPLPVYGIQYKYYPYQEQQQQGQQHDPNGGRGNKEMGEEIDAYQPLPMNPAPKQQQQKQQQPERPSEPEQAFAFQEEEPGTNERPPEFYFPHDGNHHHGRKSLRSVQDDAVALDSQYRQRDFLMEGNVGQQADDDGLYQHQRAETRGRAMKVLRHLQDNMMEPLMMEAQKQEQEREGAVGLEGPIDSRPWSPKPSPPTMPQPEPTHWWEPSDIQEDAGARDNALRPVASSPSLQQQRYLPGSVGQILEQSLILHQPLLPMGRQPPQMIFKDQTEVVGQTQGLPLAAVTGDVSVTGAPYQDATIFMDRAPQMFEDQMYLTPNPPHYTHDAAMSLLPSVLEEYARRSSFPQQSKQRKRTQQRRSSLSQRNPAPKVTVGMVRKAHKLKEPETTNDNYVLRIHDMLEDAQDKGFAHVVGWLNHGRAFKIHQSKKFYQEILPKYFPCKPSSFVRWLRAWGFVRLLEGPERGTFHHRYFVRGITSLIKNKTRNQMFEAMECWPRGGSDTISAQEGVASGGPNRVSAEMKGGSELKWEVAHVEPKKDPKNLRGRLLHDVREMLRMAEIDGFSDIVGWCKSGKAFRIYKKPQFQEQILSKYLTCAKATYLSDMLRKWGFCRLKNAKGDEKDAYFHRLFQRYKPELCRDLSKEEMFDSMEDVREEQKRLQETSWSLIAADVLMNDESQRGGNTIAISASAARSPSEKARHKGNSDVTADPFPLMQLQAPSFRSSASVVHVRTGPRNASESMSLMGEADQHGGTPLQRRQFAKAALDDGFIDTPTVTATHDSLTMWNEISNSRTKYVASVHSMLEDAERHGFSDVVSWVPHGRCFKVHNEKRFENEVCKFMKVKVSKNVILEPQICNMTHHVLLHTVSNYFSAKLPSFYRWLRAWGFTRMLGGKDRGCWYHRFFVRGATDLVQNLSRNEMMEAMKTWLKPGKEPNFNDSGRGFALSEKLLQKKDLVKEINANHGNTDHHGVKTKEENDFNNKERSAIDKLQLNPTKLRGRVPEDIRDMLDQAKAERADHVVSWLLHGRAFAIHNRSEFMERFLPRFFNVKKFEYFSDVIRNWGFVRLRESNDKGAFYHKLFRRDDPRATLHLSRKQMKASMSEWRTPDDKEPDLYEGIGDDVIRASEQMQALRGGKTKKLTGKRPGSTKFKNETRITAPKKKKVERTAEV